MRKRAAVWLAFIMIMSTFAAACGNEGKMENGPEASGTNTEAVEDGPDSLSLMKEYNTGELKVTDDNYRTWYEVFVYSFYDSDGDGIGDLNGLTEKLDYINDGDDTTETDLGCNGIWLMPIMPSTTYHKYDVTDYCDIDPEYGTIEDFKTFMEACHERGVDVIIDLVLNHSSSKHEWFTEAVSYLQGLGEGAEPNEADNKYFGYYNFSKEKGGGYCEVPGTEWYYEAQFWSEMPDLKLENENVRAEFEAVVDFWLALGVDGFRLDAAKEYYTGNVPKNVETLTWFHDMVKEKKEDAFIVAEVWSDIASYSQYYESGVSCFDFDFADAEGVIAKSVKQAGGADASSYGERIEAMQEALSAYNEAYIDAPFYTNHDMGRGAGYYSGEYSENQTKIAQAMNLLMSGSAFLYYGEELGMKGSGKDENKRAPMYWSLDPDAEGMCDGPKDMGSVKMKYDSFAEQETDGNSIFHFVRETIALRNRYPEISHGTAKLEESISNENVCVLKKSYEGEELLLLFNVSNETQIIDLSSIEAGGKSGAALEIGGVLLTGSETVSVENGKVTMPLYSALILK